MTKKVLMIVLPYLQLSDKLKTGYWGEKYARKNSPSTKMQSWPALPYGALSVATYCKDVAEIQLIDCNTDEYYHDSIAMAMVGEPDVVGITMTFDNSYTHLAGILRIVGISPKSIVVIGGAATIPVYREILDEQKRIDAVCFSDGEIPFRRLLETDDPAGLLLLDPSWVTRYSLLEGIVPKKTVVQNLDDIIELDYSFVNIENYAMREEFSPLAAGIEQKRFFMVTSKGCPFACAFCYRSRENDRKMRFASVEKVISHTRFLIENYGMTVLTLCDDQILANMKRAKEIFRQLAQFNIRVECLQGESVAFIDEEMAELMFKAGMRRVVLAIESGSQEILDRMVDKPVDLNKAKETIKILRKHGFWVTAVFVMGFPGETDAHRAETLKWVEEADLDWSTFSAAVPIKGTKLYDMCIEGGYIKPDIRLGDLDFSNYFIGNDAERVSREIYKMNLRCNFVNNYSMRQGDYETAAKAFRHVINMYEGHAFAHHYLAECWKKLDREWRLERNRFDVILMNDPKWREYAREFGIGE